MGNSQDVLNDLIKVLDKELERQESLREACQNLKSAIRVRDLEQVQAGTQTIESLVRDTVRSEQDRLRIAKKAVDVLGIARDRATMSELVIAAPQPWSARLADLQERLRSVMTDTARFVRENSALLRKSLRIFGNVLDEFQQTLHNGGKTYEATGHEGGLVGFQTQPAFLDQKG